MLAKEENFEKVSKKEFFDLVENLDFERTAYSDGEVFFDIGYGDQIGLHTLITDEYWVDTNFFKRKVD